MAMIFYERFKSQRPLRQPGSGLPEPEFIWLTKRKINSYIVAGIDYRCTQCNVQLPSAWVQEAGFVCRCHPLPEWEAYAERYDVWRVARDLSGESDG